MNRVECGHVLLLRPVAWSATLPLTSPDTDSRRVRQIFRRFVNLMPEQISQPYKELPA